MLSVQENEALTKVLRAGEMYAIAPLRLTLIGQLERSSRARARSGINGR